VRATVRFGDAVRARELSAAGDDVAVTARARERALALWPAPDAHEDLPERPDRVVPAG
jgi:hypothetical protein